MSIQSTVEIKRKDAIDRIQQIHRIMMESDYRELEQNSFEPEIDLEFAVAQFRPIYNIALIEKWTNKMLEKTMDRPFFRFSMFQNYIIID